jgi:hypothetical protein
MAKPTPSLRPYTSLPAVGRITFNPTVPPALVDTIRRLLHQLPGWEKLRIVQFA